LYPAFQHEIVLAFYNRRIACHTEPISTQSLTSNRLWNFDTCTLLFN